MFQRVGKAGALIELAPLEALVLHGLAGGAGQVGTALRDQAVKAVVDVVGAQGRDDAGALAVPLAGKAVGGVEVEAPGVAACVVEIQKQRVQTPLFSE